MFLQDDRCAFTGWTVCFYRMIGVFLREGPSARCVLTGALKNKDFLERCAITGRKVCFYGKLKNKAFRRVCPFTIQRVVHFKDIEK